MLKAPEGLLAGVPGIDGTTLLGDGRVLIVLDLQRNLPRRERLGRFRTSPKPAARESVAIALLAQRQFDGS